MVRHVVMMKFKSDVKDEQISQVEKGLGALPGIIPEIKFYEFARDEVKSDRSYDFCLVSAFENYESLKTYQVHPEHVKVLNYIGEVKENVKVVDFEF